VRLSHDWGRGTAVQPGDDDPAADSRHHAAPPSMVTTIDPLQFAADMFLAANRVGWAMLTGRPMFAAFSWSGPGGTVSASTSNAEQKSRCTKVAAREELRGRLPPTRVLRHDACRRWPPSSVKECDPGRGHLRCR